MSVIATIGVEGEDFLLGEVLARQPDMWVRLDRIIPIGNTSVPYFWAKDHSVEVIEAALRSETDVESFAVVDTAEDEALVRVEWAEDIDGLLNSIVASGADILDAVGHGGSWTIELRFENHDALTEFSRRCADRGISTDLVSVHRPGLPNVRRDFDLTDAQREAVLLALERGYFDIPRRINLVNLAAELEISDTAVSQRLRRGTSSLIEAYLAEPDAAGL